MWFVHLRTGWRRSVLVIVVGLLLLNPFLVSSTPRDPVFDEDLNLLLNTPEFENQFEKQQDTLDAILRHHPGLEFMYYPRKYAIPVDYYTYEEPTEYLMNVIFDPCKGYEYNCCDDTYGTPEFQFTETDVRLRDEGDPSYGQTSLLKQDGSELDVEISRRPDDELYFDEECEDLLSPRVDCVANRVAKKPFKTLPQCWNYNDTIVADKNCRSPYDGSTIPLCLEIAFTQTAYIVECGNAFAEDEHCGTFLEIHKPKDPSIISEIQLRGQLTSGYRMSIIPLVYKGDPTKILCNGQYELWWVQRNRHSWVVQKIMPFAVVSPRCEWDGINGEYLPYADTNYIDHIYGLDPYDPERYLFSREVNATTTDGQPLGPATGRGAGNSAGEWISMSQFPDSTTNPVGEGTTKGAQGKDGSIAYLITKTEFFDKDFDIGAQTPTLEQMETGDIEGIPYTAARNFTAVPVKEVDMSPNAGPGMGYRDWETEWKDSQAP